MIDPAWIALIGTLFGGVALKIVEQVLGRNRVRDDTATVLRTEQRGEIISLREQVASRNEEIEEKNDEIDDWRSKYYELVSAVASGDLSRAINVITTHRK